MAKPINVMSKTALAAAFTATAMVPVQTAFADEAQDQAQAELSGVVFDVNGESIVLSYQQFLDASFDIDGGEDTELANLVKDENGNIGTPDAVKVGNDYFDISNWVDANFDNEGESPEVIAQELADSYTPLTEEETSDYSDYGEEINVESVSAINTTGVTLTLEELSEDEFDATVSVVDPNGNEVAVESLDLSAGDTEVVFSFEESYDSFDDIPAGTWTINGTEYDFSEQLAVRTVRNADGGSQLELLEALQSDYFTDVDSELIAAYDGADFSQVQSVEDVQEIINQVNEDSVEDQAVKAVNDAENQIELLTALEDGGFARVNPDWIADYASYDNSNLGGGSNDAYTEATTPEEVQNIVDSVNLDAIDDNAGSGVLVDAEDSLDSADINKAESLINKYVEDDEEGQPAVKQPLLDRVEIHKAVIAVNEATTNNTLQSRLDTLAEVVDDASTFDIETVNDVLLEEYRAGIEDPTSVDSNNATETLTPANIQQVIDHVNAAELATAVSNIETNFGDGTGSTYDSSDEDDQKSALKELNRLADVSSDFDKEDIDKELIADYIDDIQTDIGKGSDGEVDWTSSATDSAKAGAISTIVNDANDSVVTDAIDEVTTAADADALLEALKDKNLDLQNVVDTNKDAYYNSPVNKNDASYFTKVTTTEEAQKVVDAVNAFVNANGATSATQMNSSINSFVAIISDSFFDVAEASDYINLSSAAKLEVSEIVFNEKDGEYADAMELAVAINNAVTAYDDFLNGASGVNNATTISEMNTALNNEDVFPEFFELSAAEKVEKAEAVFNKLQELQALENTSSFETLAEIKEAAEL
ncbi:hypothetical protein FH966_02695 [Lentibacillus cibarius]|uniref:Uncharacterized protein n=1 Tax=Lentibacillus cibarius TaxID=2583219 RepID=A0A549YFP3_9BACI|nr:hypothetical protein [Lentibacillus cibarius]TRM10710.1 hypothetical protein FH966_02695 [Lentibacillus cibarius]